MLEVTLQSNSTIFFQVNHRTKNRNESSIAMQITGGILRVAVPYPQIC